MKKLLYCIFVLTSISLFAQTTIETKLLVTTNDGTNGGSFKVAIQAKGTNLTGNNTIGSATIDVYYTAADIAPVILGGNLVDGTYGLGSDYTKSLTYVSSGPYIRLSISGGGVNGSGGFDLTTSYQTLATIYFTISNSTVSTSLTIDEGSLTIGLFTTPNNSDFSGDIDPQTMSTPVNITNEPLPVELSSFTVSGSHNVINLKWQTATEVNNNGFEIERASVDPQSAIRNPQFTKVGFVQGYGNSNSPKDYTYVDKNLTGGTKFIYRLKQIDNDGKYQYSKEVEVEVVPKQYTLYQNYPNPFNPTTTIKFDMPQAGEVTLTVYNILGEKVRTLVNGMREAGYHTIVFDARNLASGTYIYRLQAPNYVQTKKMLLLK